MAPTPCIRTSRGTHGHASSSDLGSAATYYVITRGGPISLSSLTELLNYLSGCVGDYQTKSEALSIRASRFF